MFKRRIVITALAVIACAVPASATISYYASSSLFNAANVSAVPESFDGLATNSTYSSLSQDGFNFISTSTYNFNLTVLANPGGSWPTSPTTKVLAQVSSGGFSNGAIVITLPANVYAVAFYTSFALASDDVAIVVTAGSAFPSFVTNTGPTSPGFFGARSDQAITSITLSKPSTQSFTFGYAVQMGELLFDTVSGTDTGGGGGGETPESGSLFLIGTGLALLPLLHRRFGGKRT